MTIEAMELLAADFQAKLWRALGAHAALIVRVPPESFQEKAAEYGRQIRAAAELRNDVGFPPEGGTK